MNIVGLNFAGFFQRGTKEKPEEEPITFGMTVLYYDSRKKLFIARGNDKWGESAISGITTRVYEKDKVVMLKNYLEEPKPFPLDFDYRQTMDPIYIENSPIFRAYNYIGDLTVKDVLLKLEGNYRSANSHNSNEGFFELTAEIPKR